MHTNRIVFGNLGGDALLFFTGTCALPPLEASHVDGNTQYIALRHASAFLRAQPAENPQDFQVIVPALLSALQSADKRVRVAALDCVVAISSLCSAPKSSSVYAYDEVYGAASGTSSCTLLQAYINLPVGSLQYLDMTDERRYIASVAEHRDHISNDPTYICELNQQVLVSSKADGKKDVK